MKRINKVLAILIMALMIALLSVTTAFCTDVAYEVKDGGFTVTLPDDMLTITRECEKNDPYFAKFGLDYDETMANFTQGNIYLQSIKEDSSVTFTAAVIETEESRQLHSYKDMSENELSSLKETLLQDKTYKSCSITRYNGNIYMNLTVNVKSGKKTVQALQCHTVADGKDFSFTLQPDKGKKISNDNKALMSAILNSVSIVEKNFFTENKETIIFGAIILGAFIVVLVLFIILYKHIKNPHRKNKNIIHQLAHEHQISETTQIPRGRVGKHIVEQEFLEEYEPLEDIEAPKPTPAKIQAEKTVSTPAPREELIDTTEETPIESVESAEPEQAVQAEESFENIDEYFDDVPEQEELYSYSDVNKAVEDYSEAKRQSLMDYDEKDTGHKENKAVAVLKAIGKGLLTALQYIGLFLCFVIIHCKYFCINVYRLIKKKLAQRKKKKQQLERKRRAEERSQRQREAEMARRRQNSNRGENDLVKVRSSSYPARRPQNRSGREYYSNRNSSGRTKRY